MTTDSSGNKYFDTGNIRVTSLKQTWSGEPGIRIQAYKGHGKSLHNGAEIPISTKESAFDVLRAILYAIEDNDK